MRPALLSSNLFVSSSQVKRQLERLNLNEAAGPDGVCPRVLKASAEQTGFFSSSSTLV